MPELSQLPHSSSGGVGEEVASGVSMNWAYLEFGFSTC